MRLMRLDEDPKGAVNLGNPEELTIAELAQRVVELVGSRSKVQYFPLPQDDPRQRCPDITRARELLGWRPRVALEEGLKRTIAYFEELLSADALSQHARPLAEAQRPRVDLYMVGLKEAQRTANGSS
jgi:UDP-glucuronate decarboxylase